jgi:hypothetical protein
MKIIFFYQKSSMFIGAIKYKLSQYCNCVKRGRGVDKQSRNGWSLKCFFSKQHPHLRRQSVRTSPMLFTRNKVLEQCTVMHNVHFCPIFCSVCMQYQIGQYFDKMHPCAVWHWALHKSLNSTPFLRLTERCLWVAYATHWLKKLKMFNCYFWVRLQKTDENLNLALKSHAYNLLNQCIFLAFRQTIQETVYNAT